MWNSSNNIHTPMGTLLGGSSVTESMIRGSVAPLQARLSREFHSWKTGGAPLVRQIRKNASLTHEALPNSALGFRVHFAAGAPYTSRWTDGSAARANHLLGEWSVSSRDTGHSSAGIVAFFVPERGRFPVRFYAHQATSYDYHIFANTFFPWFVPAFARGSGLLGAYVAAWDGREWVSIADSRRTLWDTYASFTGSHDESDPQNFGLMPTAEFTTLGDPFTFALWAWGRVDTFVRNGIGVADSFGSISATTRFMLVSSS